MRIGVIGAESTHVVAIAKLVNIDKEVDGMSIDYLWDEKPAFASETAARGGIPHIVNDAAEMMPFVDAVIVAHRHPQHHLSAALPFVSRGIPVFIDKPFCYRVAEGKRFLEQARQADVPVDSFSIMPLQQSFLTFQNKSSELGEIQAGTSFGPCDIDSEYGGVFFYGIHQVEMTLHAFGCNVVEVLLSRHGDNAVGQMFYDDGKIVTLHFIKACPAGFSLSVVGEQGCFHQSIEFDESLFLSAVRRIAKLFQTRQSQANYDLILRTIGVLEAMEASLASGRREGVSVSFTSKETGV